jgi:TonB family protein
LTAPVEDENVRSGHTQGEIMKALFLASTVLCGAALSGCATAIEGTSQGIAITTLPAAGATCVLSGREGSWSVVSPGVVRVEKSKEDIAVHCSKPGWQDAAATIPSNFQGWTLGNIVLGGLVGVGVDAATGAIHEYPHAFNVQMTPLPGTVVDSSRAGSFPDGPPRLDTSGVNMQPNYPEGSVASGTVAVAAMVRDDGTVQRVALAKSSGYSDLDAAATNAVLHWKFLPAMEHGQPVSGTIVVQIVFQPPDE